MGLYKPSIGERSVYHQLSVRPVHKHAFQLHRTHRCAGYLPYLPNRPADRGQVFLNPRDLRHQGQVGVVPRYIQTICPGHLGISTAPILNPQPRLHRQLHRDGGLWYRLSAPLQIREYPRKSLGGSGIGCFSYPILAL